MSKELEALNRIFNGMSNNVGYIKYFENIRQALTELEELKRDVKRYIELIDLDDLITDEQIAEQLELHLKFQKVGNEE